MTEFALNMSLSCRKGVNCKASHKQTNLNQDLGGAKAQPQVAAPPTSLVLEEKLTEYNLQIRLQPSKLRCSQAKTVLFILGIVSLVN